MKTDGPCIIRSSRQPRRDQQPGPVLRRRFQNRLIPYSSFCSLSGTPCRVVIFWSWLCRYEGKCQKITSSTSHGNLQRRVWFFLPSCPFTDRMPYGPRRFDVFLDRHFTLRDVYRLMLTTDDIQRGREGSGPTSGCHRRRVRPMTTLWTIRLYRVDDGVELCFHHRASLPAAADETRIAASACGVTNPSGVRDDGKQSPGHSQPTITDESNLCADVTGGAFSEPSTGRRRLKI